MKLYCPVLAVLFVLAVGVAAGGVIETQHPFAEKIVGEK